MKISDYINRIPYLTYYMKIDATLTIETISENWLRNKLIRLDILKKYDDKVFLKRINQNKCYVDVYDLNFLYKVYDILCVRQDKHKIVFCYSSPFVNCEITRGRIRSLNLKRNYNFFCKLLKR